MRQACFACHASLVGADAAAVVRTYVGEQQVVFHAACWLRWREAQRRPPPAQ